MTERPPAHDVLAQFADARQLVAATRLAWALGYRHMEAYAPFPLEELEPLLPQPASRVPWTACAGAVFGALLGLGLQVLPALTYPLDIGGRPLIVVPSLMVVTFLMSVLFAAFAVVLSFFWGCRLPRLNHPIFAAEAFERAGDDRFFLCIYADDPQFEVLSTGNWLREQALQVSEVPR
ncbi:MULTISPECIES: DUF3341 domain-containing protein [unclassified Pseudomonas]|uniref:DUF3341 domain-containing protein n=1 Tax=unclassified Pseudomonas TaxID=196821 RepID=UPI002AC93C4E|nr:MULTISPECIES: DUF3341 domain-containing protein [unclassified Pseudomonas]MEB0040039.1 DUF3341 domain-containing protein [Pseudomonas sp. MH10]MEB0119564.1 DUF3341 domain-containing protein [Pseudomonas sp. CCI1.2]WPX65169.1 DUF3341 domain-containing protein [Pseudomonas sp. MH10]